MGKTHKALKEAENRYRKLNHRIVKQAPPKRLTTPSGKTFFIKRKNLYGDLKNNLLAPSFDGTLKTILFINTCTDDESENPFDEQAAQREKDISFSENKWAEIKVLAESGVPVVVAFNLSGPLTVLPKDLKEITKASLIIFDVLDKALLDVVFGKSDPVGKLPFELPSSMDAVRKQLEDVPFDTENPMFKFGEGLSYDSKH